MRHPGLILRMVVAGSILFAFYLLVATAMIVAGFSLPIVAVITLAFVGFQWKFGQWAALRSVGAEEVDEDSHPELYRTVERLSRDMDVPMPRVMVASMGAPNAFAVGRKGAGTVVVATELMQVLDDQELEGVLAHELAHIRNRDVVMMVLGQSIASLVGIVVTYAMLFGGRRNIGAYLAAWIAGSLAQMLVMVFVLAISRYREYVADADAAVALGTGDPLARALEKIQHSNEQGQEAAVRTPQRGHQQPAPGASKGINDNVSALCIFDAPHGLLRSIFSTHPPVEKRIDRLRTGTF
ncbi:MAG: M48 family metalloprotease [Halobacteriales archaeon]